MDGIFIGHSRPKSKKAVKLAVAESPASVVIESTSIMGGYHGNVENAPDGDYLFVGPDPYRDRKFYGTITVRAGQYTVK